MKNHVKQMLRTPVHSVFIVILIMIVTVMLSVGGNLWIVSDRFSKMYEEDFITIGTVTQKPDAVKKIAMWDAEKEGYLFYKANRYNSYVSPEDLKFPETTFIAGPEKRVYWASYVPEYLHIIETWPLSSDFFWVAEFSPKEDGIPDQSMKIEIKKVLGSDKTMEGSVVWFCEHDNPAPDELKADKTYITVLVPQFDTHGKRWEESGSSYRTQEYIPYSCVAILYTEDGQKMKGPDDVEDIYEVTEGFYDTGIGQRFLVMADLRDVFLETQPVVGTNSINLLRPFYEGKAWVYMGRYPTQEEFEKGSEVCLVPRAFAENNGLSVGDRVMTRLYYTNARGDVSLNFALSGGGMSFQPIDFEGKLLQPFEEKEYTIVGLYDYMPLVDGIGRDELIVPLNSVQNQTANIVDYGAMADENTSFQIENGTIADFMEVSAKYDTDNLIFTFYDRGYSALMEGIENLRNMSITLLVMGVIAAIVLSLQISHIYITKQKRQLSIERLMGMTKKRCRHISMAGILLLLILGTVPGMAAGTILADEISMSDRWQENGNQEDEGSEEVAIAEQDTGETTGQTVPRQAERDGSGQMDGTSEAFSRKYSNLGLAVEMKDIELSMQNQGSMAVSGIMGCLVILLGMGFSDVKIRKVLREEPLYLLEDSMAGRR